MGGGRVLVQPKKITLKMSYNSINLLPLCELFRKYDQNLKISIFPNIFDLTKYNEYIFLSQNCFFDSIIIIYFLFFYRIWWKMETDNFHGNFDIFLGYPLNMLYPKEFFLKQNLFLI